MFCIKRESPSYVFYSSPCRKMKGISHILEKKNHSNCKQIIYIMICVIFTRAKNRKIMVCVRALFVLNKKKIMVKWKTGMILNHTTSHKMPAARGCRCSTVYSYGKHMCCPKHACGVCFKCKLGLMDWLALAVVHSSALTFYLAELVVHLPVLGLAFAF